jgi:hypothetical protein
MGINFVLSHKQIFRIGIQKACSRIIDIPLRRIEAEQKA